MYVRWLDRGRDYGGLGTMPGTASVLRLSAQPQAHVMKPAEGFDQGEPWQGGYKSHAICLIAPHAYYSAVLCKA